MKRISEHISYREGIKSPTAHRLGIDNTPTDVQLKAMKLVAEKCFEPLREHFNAPIKVESFFRCLQLNRALGSTDGSQHIKGEAIDIDDDYGGLTNADMFVWLVNNVEYDQIIWEFGSDQNPGWIHISYREGRNRGRLTVADRKGGRTRYSHFSSLNELLDFLSK